MKTLIRTILEMTKSIVGLLEENAKLKAENARLTSLLGEYSLKADAYRNAEDITQQSNYDLSMENFKLRQTLQEIKEVAEANQFYFEPGTIVSYKTIKQIATNFDKILDLITKAEKE